MHKKIIKSLTHKLGYDLRRYNPASSTESQLISMINHHKINLIFDIGANIGQFGEMLRIFNYSGRIVSFEPMPNEHEKLLEISKKDKLWAIAPRVALGDEEDDILINISANSQSSSILKILDTHTNAAPESAYVKTECVPQRRLDSLALNYLTPDSISFLKIDTQGFEDRVLSGATQTLKNVAGLQLELSLVPLYEGQLLFNDLIQKVLAEGFHLWSIAPVFIDTSSGRLLQVDATFFRQDNL